MTSGRRALPLLFVGVRRPARDRGAAALQAAIVVPLVMTLIFTIVQAGLWYHARSVASSAAQVAVQASRAYDGSAANGQAAGMTYISQVGGLDTPSVGVNRGAVTTTATVTGSTASLVPGLPIPSINVRAEAATERLTG